MIIITNNDDDDDRQSKFEFFFFIFIPLNWIEFIFFFLPFFAIKLWMDHVYISIYLRQWQFVCLCVCVCIRLQIQLNECNGNHINYFIIWCFHFKYTKDDNWIFDRKKIIRRKLDLFIELDCQHLLLLSFLLLFF